MTHYVVLCDWAVDHSSDSGIEFHGITHTLEEAKEIFAEAVLNEKEYANENGWDILTDTDTEFDAGHFGYYNAEHTHLYIQEVK